jgi:phage terminase small subunit
MNDKQLTQKQENFALEYIECGNASEAYRRAYNAENMKPESIHSKAYEVLQVGEVSVRILELQEAHREAHRVTVDSLCTELDEARELAIESTQPSAAISATATKMKLYGLGVEKRQTHVTGHMTFDEAEAILKEAGLDYD